MIELVVALAIDVGERGELVRKCLNHLHAERFDAALATATQLKERWPAHPAGSLAAANVYQTMMRDYRVRAFEEPFGANLREAIARAEAEVREKPSAEAFFARGTALAYHAAHRFTCGDPLRGVLDAIHGVGDARRALENDPSFVDPMLLVTLFDFWKAEKLGLGLGLFGGGRRMVVSRLHKVRTEGRFLSVEAEYALQTVHYLQREYAEALHVNEALRARFPHNPVALYYGGLLLGHLGRDAESLRAWDALLERLEAFPHRSHGFAAETLLHRSLILRRAGRAGEAREALDRARKHVSLRVAAREMDGPLVRFDDVARKITSCKECTR